MDSQLAKHAALLQLGLRTCGITGIVIILTNENNDNNNNYYYK